MKLLVMSHRYGGNQANLDLARKACAAMNEVLYPVACVIIPWEPLCREWPEEEMFREIGFGVTERLLGASSGLVPVGAQSTGMLSEKDTARSLGVEVFPLPEFGSLQWPHAVKSLREELAK